MKMHTIRLGMLLGAPAVPILFAALAIAAPGLNEFGATMYEDENFQDTPCPIRFRQNIPDLNRFEFGNQADSMRWRIPRGWCLVLFDRPNYQTPLLVVDGIGSIRDLENGKNSRGKDLNIEDKFESVGWYPARQVATDPAFRYAQRVR